MINKAFYLLFLLISVALFFQCQPNKQEDSRSNTIAEFTVRYLEGEQQLRGQASFFEGDSIGNKMPIQIEGGVSFIRSGMKERLLPNDIIRYEGTLKGPIVLPLLFGFKLAGDEKPREVSFTMSPVNDYAITSAGKKEGLRIELSSPVNKDESLLFLFTDPNGEARTIIRPGPLDNTDLFIPTDALLHFIPGQYGVYLVKSKKITAIQDGVSFQARIEYYSKELTFDLLP